MKLPWRVLPPLAPDRFGDLHRRAVFEACKWDPQVEDVSVLAPFPVVFSQAAWEELVRLAERLARETEAAELELTRRPELWSQLGLPRRARSALQPDPNPARPPRIARFDFHYTDRGWQISEANTDVPGGLNEASGFTRLMLDHYPAVRMCGDPVAALAEAIRDRVPPGAEIALVHATAYTDDRQVMAFLARHLELRGYSARLVGPDHLRWRDGLAWMEADWFSGQVDLIVRFFPAEWLPNLPGSCGWRNFFGASRTPLCNPGSALLTQSKRFPLVWDSLETRLDAWRQLLPETRDPRRLGWRPDATWVLKPALGRVGDSIGLEGVTPAREWARIRRSARFFPCHWAAQRRFDLVPLETAGGLVYPCFGVYTVDGKAAGVYGRIAKSPIINHLAQEIAVFVEDSACEVEPALPGAGRFLRAEEPVPIPAGI